jgi:phospholipase C
MLRIKSIERENMTALKKKSETCEEQLRRMCKAHAEEITNGKDEDGRNIYMQDFMEGVYDIEWITFQDHSYKAARLLVAGGGPNIWVNTQDGTVDGYWGTDKVHWHYTDNIGLDDYLSELHASSK